jgi:hypothetical protein
MNILKMKSRKAESTTMRRLEKNVQASERFAGESWTSLSKIDDKLANVIAISMFPKRRAPKERTEKKRQFFGVAKILIKLKGRAYRLPLIVS